jgi:hypothetical protein
VSVTVPTMLPVTLPKALTAARKMLHSIKAVSFTT